MVTDWESRGIDQYDKVTGASLTPLPLAIDRPMGIKLIAAARQPGEQA